MKRDDFIKALRASVWSFAVRHCQEILCYLPDDEPDPRRRALKAWYQQLTTEERQRVRDLLCLVTNDTIHAFLRLLDQEGARPPNEGRLELTDVGPEGRTLINGVGPDSPRLSWLWNTMSVTWGLGPFPYSFIAPDSTRSPDP